MGWSGDTPALQPRELNFGAMREHLARQQADVIIASWGMNEAFEGEAGLARFESDLLETGQSLSMGGTGTGTPTRGSHGRPAGN